MRLEAGEDGAIEGPQGEVEVALIGQRLLPDHRVVRVTDGQLRLQAVATEGASRHRVLGPVCSLSFETWKT